MNHLREVSFHSGFAVEEVWSRVQSFLDIQVRNKKDTSLYNRGQSKNPDISGALYTLRMRFTQTQCGARDVRFL